MFQRVDVRHAILFDQPACRNATLALNFQHGPQVRQLVPSWAMPSEIGSQTRVGDFGGSGRLWIARHFAIGCIALTNKAPMVCVTSMLAGSRPGCRPSAWRNSPHRRGGARSRQRRRGSLAAHRSQAGGEGALPRPVRQQQRHAVALCVPVPRDHPQSPFQFLFRDHFRLRHRSNPILCLGNVSFGRFG